MTRPVMHRAVSPLGDIGLDAAALINISGGAEGF